jgi:hypothetical protein
LQNSKSREISLLPKPKRKNAHERHSKLEFLDYPATAREHCRFSAAGVSRRHDFNSAEATRVDEKRPEE